MPTSDQTSDVKVTSRRGADPRGVWMRQNLPCKPFDTGRFIDKPMSALRIATIVANMKVAA